MFGENTDDMWQAQDSGMEVDPPQYSSDEGSTKTVSPFVHSDDDEGRTNNNNRGFVSSDDDDSQYEQFDMNEAYDIAARDHGLEGGFTHTDTRPFIEDDDPPSYDTAQADIKYEDGFRYRPLIDAMFRDAKDLGSDDEDDEDEGGDVNWCFLCYLRKNPKTSSFDAFSDMVTWMRKNFENEMGPRAYCEAVQAQYNDKLREHFEGDRHWHKQSIWNHVTVHTLDPFYAKKKQERAQKTIIDVILRSQVYQVHAIDGTERIDMRAARAVFQLMKHTK